MGREKKTRKQLEWARAQQVRKDGGNSRFGNGIMVMPKWQPPSAVDWFGPTHKGLDFHGDSKSVVHMFGDYHAGVQTSMMQLSCEFARAMPTLCLSSMRMRVRD